VATISVVSSRAIWCSSITATTGDGLVAALQLIAIVLREQAPLSELARNALERVPQVLVNGSFPRRAPLDQLPRTSRHIQMVEKSLGKQGRVLVRWSGTEPKLRVMIEGPDPKRIKQLANDILQTAHKELQ
jgi:phosphoglucosamine mutase